MLKTKYKAIILLSALSFFGLWLSAPNTVQAAAIITVNSKADNTTAANGLCTLREAIVNANANSDTTSGDCVAGNGEDTINFNITGAADYTLTDRNSVVKNGYTIAPTSALPDITDTLHINGYSQPGSLANNAVSPNPFNGSLLIELNGANAGTVSGLIFGSTINSTSEGSSVKGLVINRYSYTAGSTRQAVFIRVDNFTLQGNYIGTDPTGLIARGNGCGFSTDTTIADLQGGLIGGLDPEDRNIISGNGDSAGYPRSNYVIQGNYVGLDSAGTGALGNQAVTATAGAFSIDESINVTIGGPQPTAMNIISGNYAHGLAPGNTPEFGDMNLLVQNNRFGTDYSGEVAIPNIVGITMGGDLGGSVIRDNLLSGNALAGIIVAATTGADIRNNIIGLNKTGQSPLPNTIGIWSSSSPGVIIGGSTDSRNIISGNSGINIMLRGLYQPDRGMEVSGNYIGTNIGGDVTSGITNVQGPGIVIEADTQDAIIGGSAPNLIAGNRGFGVGVGQITATNFGGAVITPTHNSILGNEIRDNVAHPGIPGSTGLGIDLYKGVTNTPDGYFDLLDSYTDTGPNTNSVAGSTPGEANDYINHPVLSQVTYNSTVITPTFDLVAAGASTGSYRVEFYANSSNKAEGAKYLGFTNVTPGTGRTASLSVPSGYSMAGKYITATATEQNSGVGSTSEFSQPIQAVLGAETSTPRVAVTSGGGKLAETGQDMQQILFASVFIITFGLAVSVSRRRYSYKIKSR